MEVFILGVVVGAAVTLFLVVVYSIVRIGSKPVPEIDGASWWRGYLQGTYDGHVSHPETATEAGERMAAELRLKELAEKP